MTDQKATASFIERWTASSAHERRHKDMFFAELCDALGVERPDPKDNSGDYCFERAVTIETPDGRTSTGFIDFYRRGSFVWEAKQGSEIGDDALGTARRGTALWDKAMRGAYGQALRYAAYLPEGKPPFLMTADIGNCFEIWSGFSGHYGGYGARRTIELAQLADPAVRDFLVKVFTDPLDLDPARHAQRVTREVAAKLADLARDLEKFKHDPELVAQFLMRCLFTMFAEDVGLLPEKLFTRAVAERWLLEPRRFPAEVEQLWKAMNDGLPFGFEAKLLRFNGGLFKNCRSIPMTAAQLQLLLDAAKCDWANVEPTIFGTLLERALDPFERQRLGAHFTPREYIERLVRPAVIEPLRAEWEIAQAQARQILEEKPSSTDVERAKSIFEDFNGQVEKYTEHKIETRQIWEKEVTWARQILNRSIGEPSDDQKKRAAKVLIQFHDKLLTTRVLDPACGSGNFLFVCLDLFKQIEAEVIRELSDLLGEQMVAESSGNTVNPSQFLGIELNPRAREIADLVLWIGYLQWYRRVHGDLQPVEPILREYKNIVCRDAVLAYDDIRPRVDENARPITTWDQRTFKTHPITGKEVPDEDARVPVLDYLNARPAEWPEADYVVSNPPFIGNKRMRAALGDGYCEALRGVYPTVTSTADLVMYWWNAAATLVQTGKLKRFGFITTNSITQTFNRQVLECFLDAEKNPLVIAWAIPDHPWVDAGADVRIAMTIGVNAAELTSKPILDTVIFEEKEQFKEPQARRLVTTSRSVQRIHADLSGGADVAGAVPLKANKGLSFQGMILIGDGFRLAINDLTTLGYEKDILPPVIRPYLNGQDLVGNNKNRLVIDLHGMTEKQVVEKYPRIYQWVHDKVRPLRLVNKEKYRRENWWLFGRPNTSLREAVVDLKRFIITPETTKYRIFVFISSELVPDHKLYAVCIEDASFFGVLSSRFHAKWALEAGGTLGPTPTWTNSTCFEPFPFPDAADDQKARIRELGERLDAHRKRVQAEHPDVTLTGMYNALERLREIDREGGPALTEKERAFHEKALIGVLKQIHDDLDAAVADAYGWPVDLPDDELLARLVALNHERAEEEKRGIVRWLRPDFQKPTGKTTTVQPQLDGLSVPEKAATPAGPRPWPTAVADQLKAIRDLLAARPGSWSVEEIAAEFKGARKASVLRHLDSLTTLALLICHDEGETPRWSVVR